jgi:hypothetical protein
MQNGVVCLRGSRLQANMPSSPVNISNTLGFALREELRVRQQQKMASLVKGISMRTKNSTMIQYFNQLIDERKYGVAHQLWNNLKENKIHITDDTKVSIIEKLHTCKVLPEMARDCLFSLDLNTYSFEKKEILHCKVIKISGACKKLSIAENVANNFEKSTPRLRNALAYAYLHAGKVELIRPEDLSIEGYLYGGRYDLAAYHINYMKYSAAMGDSEKAFESLEKGKAHIRLVSYYLYKTNLMLQFKMYDELDEVVDSMKDHADVMHSFIFTSLLKHYKGSTKKEDKERITFLESFGENQDHVINEIPNVFDIDNLFLGIKYPIKIAQKITE